jgi:hypothetical protein
LFTVALIVKKGVCSFEQKAKAASTYIYPPGVVKYLIIYGDTWKYEMDDGLYLQDEEPIRLVKLSPDEQQLAIDDIPLTTMIPATPSYEESLITGAAPFSSLQIGRSKGSHHHGHQDSSGSVSVLHVSYSVGYELMEVLNHQSPKVQQQGGPRIILNSTQPLSRNRILLGISFGAFMVAMCLCCLLRADFLMIPEPNQTPRPQPPARRRLTREQVKSKFPVCVFDGTKLVVILGSTIEQEDDENKTEHRVAPHDLETCAICLDDYEPGGKLRCLPCSHTFHARCIGKWLTERSATCPLCKVELYEEERDEEGGVAVSLPVSDLTASWLSLASTTTVDGTTAAAANTAATTTNENQWWMGFRFGSWGRNLVSSRRHGETTDNYLTEPLLVQEMNEGNVQPTTTQEPESPPTNNDSRQEPTESSREEQDSSSQPVSQLSRPADSEQTSETPSPEENV